MTYMMLIYMEEDAMTQAERQACYEESTTLAQELHRTGRLIAASPLEPVSTARSVRLKGDRAVVTDGPFVETREQLGGFYLIEAADLDEAIDIAGRIPPARKGVVEIRPVFELEGMPEPALRRMSGSR